MEGSPGGPGKSRAEIEARNLANSGYVARQRMQNAIRGGSSGRGRGGSDPGKENGPGGLNDGNK
jgi:hypothetical protein